MTAPLTDRDRIESNVLDAHEHLQGLVGKTVHTLTGKPNRVIAVRADTALVGTGPSPDGKPVPIAEVQAAMDRLVRDGEIEISVGSVGYRSAFIGAVLATLPGAEALLRPRRIRLKVLHFPSLFPAAVNPPVELELFSGPVDLVRQRLALPATPGVYVVSCGDCIPHIGTSGNLRNRVGTLAALGTHRGSAEVLCAAYCTQQPPLIWWYQTDKPAALAIERNLKLQYGEPPFPRDKHVGCVNGARLLSDITNAAGSESWEAGYAEAVLKIGEKLSLLFAPRFRPVWESLGVPPGPWRVQ